VAGALQTIDYPSFRQRYLGIDSGDYAFPVSEGDCQYAWRRLRDIRDFYRDAVDAGMAVAFTASTRTLAITDLERGMRPGAWSQGGFLGLEDALEEVIVQDRETLASLAISHEQIASDLEEILLAGRDAGASLEQGVSFGPVLVLKLGGYLGFQGCPWGCDNVNMESGANRDFALLNRQTGERIELPGLIVHLIREHHFFEGFGSPYRVDAEKLVRILELQPCRDLGS
jgi:hypothetical protein